ncbi:MAG: hypothetical protein AB1756_07770 [Acidobacteriota bacterium]
MLDRLIEELKKELRAHRQERLQVATDLQRQNGRETSEQPDRWIL